MTGDELIALAGNLAVNTGLGTDEARFRSAVSRAYYGAFHLSCALLSDFGITVRRNADGHSEVYRALWATQVREAQQVARLLSSLRSERNRADYDLLDPEFRKRETATVNVEAAHEIRLLVEACRREPVRSAIRAHFQSS